MILNEGKDNVMVDALGRCHVSCAFLVLKEYEQLHTLFSIDLSHDDSSGVVHSCSMVVTP